MSQELTLFTHKSVMVKLSNVEAYNVKLKQMDYMDVSDVIKTPIMKEGKATGNYRYRLAGKGTDGTGMSKFINKDDADDYARQLGKAIKLMAAKPRAPKKSCKKIGEDAKKACDVRRAPAKRAAAKKSAAKRVVRRSTKSAHLPGRRLARG